VDTDVSGIAADALGARRIGTLAFELTEQFVDVRLTVPDEAVRAAQQWLWQSLRVLVEPAGATALAALLNGAYQAAEGERVGVVVCGANTEPAKFSG